MTLLVLVVMILLAAMVAYASGESLAYYWRGGVNELSRQTGRQAGRQTGRQANRRTATIFVSCPLIVLLSRTRRSGNGIAVDELPHFPESADTAVAADPHSERLERHSAVSFGSWNRFPSCRTVVRAVVSRSI